MQCLWDPILRSSFKTIDFRILTHFNHWTNMEKLTIGPAKPRLSDPLRPRMKKCTTEILTHSRTFALLISLSN